MALHWSRLSLRFTQLAFMCLCVMLLCSTSGGAAESLDVFGSANPSGGGRNLLQIRNPCPHQFGLDNFTNLILSCPPINSTATANYPKKACCGALALMLCPYLSYINDRKSDCAANFFSALNFVTNGTLTQMDIESICTDTNEPNGVPCPSTPAPAPNYSAPRLARKFPPVALLMIAISLLFSWL